jgi:hypothetical protein
MADTCPPVPPLNAGDDQWQYATAKPPLYRHRPYRLGSGDQHERWAEQEMHQLPWQYGCPTRPVLYASPHTVGLSRQDPAPPC